MGYEDAPGTKLLATHCAICARPLLDAVSVERGIGPDCAKKHGYFDGGQEGSAAHKEANRVVHAIALQVSGATKLDAGELNLGIQALKVGGFGRLAAVLEEKIPTVVVEPAGEGIGEHGRVEARLKLSTPYNPRFVEALRNLPGRRWDKEQKVWTVPATENARVIVFTLLKAFYPGVVGRGSKGFFVVPGELGRA